VVGILALALVEYTRFLAQIIEPDRPERRLVSAAFMKAQRLGQSLLARPSFLGTAWTRGVDAFYQQGGEDAWFIPSYSICLRAVLEVGVADPMHPLVRDALDTIALLEAEPGRDGWLDPTYHTGLDKEGSEASHLTRLSRRQHPQQLTEPQDPGLDYAELDVRAAINRGVTGWEVTAASTHAAALAFSAVRRAWSRTDPRTLPTASRSKPADDRTRPPARVLAESPFDLIRIKGRWKPFVVELLRDDESYSEQSELTALGTWDLLRALKTFKENDQRATTREIQEELRRIRKTRKRARLGTGADRPLDTPFAIASRIDKTNLFFGFQLIQSSTDAGQRDTRYWISDSTRVEFQTD
jgi:hypothetical protein